MWRNMGNFSLSNVTTVKDKNIIYFLYSLKKAKAKMLGIIIGALGHRP